MKAAAHWRKVTPWIAGVQWLLFMFANTVVIPVSVGYALHMNAVQLAAFTERSFVFTGVACLLQGLVGHRLPLMEGQSGVWWGVVLSVFAASAQTGVSLAVAGGSLEVGIALSGLLIAGLGLFGVGRLLRRWFSPVVMAVFLFLLATDLIAIFFRGMLGVSRGGVIDVPVALLSVGLVAWVLFLQVKGPVFLRNFAILTGLVVGWIVYRTFLHAAEPVATSYDGLFSLFTWGQPTAVIGIVLTAVLTGLINTTNTVATLESAGELLEVEIGAATYRRSLAITGLWTFLSGIFALVPYAPYTSSIGFLRATRIFDRLPFFIGAGLFIILGLWPTAGAFVSTLPASVGDAVLLVAYLQLFGSALQYLEKVAFDHRSIYRVALPTLIGIALFATPATAFQTVPEGLRTFLENGLLVGVMLSVVLENFRKSDEPAAPPTDSFAGSG